VLIDRIFNGDDSAEHLFRYLRTQRRDINAWFVIEKGTADYRRLRRDGFKRVMPHGSLAWKLLMLNAQHLISSHIDDVVVSPKAIRRLVEPRWRVTFLQHGVIKDDLATWLDKKEIDVFITSTPAEQESIVGDHTSYRCTTREAVLTGLPRFDRLLEEGRRISPEQQDLLLVAPTWRRWLSTAENDDTGRHSVDVEDFATSEFAEQWTSVVNSPELKELADKHGLTVAVLLHPNFQSTARLDLAPHVRALGFEGQNVLETFARARVLVTDYSSMFFNAAYIDRPVVYFQFDRDRVESGWHLGRHGYFDYEHDGFGPVTYSAGEALAAITKTVESGPAPDPVYLDRIRAAFPLRDGRCCERVTNAIAQSTRPVQLTRG
jgi:CDP-glycerol glycerophosphotransferase (TagB/SpsB family)